LEASVATSEAKNPSKDIPPPEPDLTPSEIIRRAEAMRPMLRERQNACEAAGQVSEDTNAQFIAAGFYRILQPRCFGGYEFDLPTFLKVMIAISRGCSDSGWVLALTAGHAFLMASFPEAGQREAFGDKGEFRAPGVAIPGGVAVPVDGGYRVKGAWDYTSGCHLATHFIGSSVIKKRWRNPGPRCVHPLRPRSVSNRRQLARDRHAGHQFPPRDRRRDFRARASRPARMRRHRPVHSSAPRKPAPRESLLSREDHLAVGF
jgi:hypothetical protein